MNHLPASAELQLALRLSQRILSEAEGDDPSSLAALDAERMQLLQSFRREQRHVTTANRELLDQIRVLNDRAVGMLEHRKRGKGREMDMAAVGRRALAAYGNVRLQR